MFQDRLDDVRVVVDAQLIRNREQQRVGGHHSLVCRELDEMLALLHRNLFVESNPIPVKWALERMGMIPPGIRLPLTPLAAEFQAPVETALRRARLV